MIEMYGVWKVYENGNDALQNIDIKIGRGEFVYVVGPSGAGKSTFIKLMYREERPTKGQIYINGINVDKVKERKIPQIRRNIGVVFQDFRLLPRMTSFENVAFAMEVVETPRKRIEQRVRELFELVGFGRPDGRLSRRAVRRRDAARCYRPGHGEQAVGHHRG